MKSVFFGSSQFSIHVLNELEARGALPALIITLPDKPRGRKLVLTPNIVKVWAEKRGIEVIDPKSPNNSSIINKLKAENYDLFLVAAYGKILKKEIFDIPKYKTLNIHPSLLPKYRGASPMISQILNDEKDVGTSIMLIDEGMDTGPVLAQRELTPSLGEGQGVGKVLSIQNLEKIVARESVDLLLEVLPRYMNGDLKPVPQDDTKATYTEKIKKEDGLLDLTNNPHNNFLKIKAFAEWPRAYFFHGGKRIIVTDATLDESGNLKILMVIPEGKKEMPYEDFQRGNN